MAVCQYFLRGQCRFGDGCRNEHPSNGDQTTFGTTGGNTWTKTPAASNAKSETLPYDANSIANDLRQGGSGDKPIWPLACYAPAKHEPILVPGLDESSEELRVKAYSAIQAGNLNEYLAYEGNQIAAANQVYANVRANSAEAFDKARKQSNLIPYVEQPTNTTSAFPSTSSAFAPQPGASAFGTTPTTTSVFGQPAFGQTAFGQPSTTAPVSAFGQPAQAPPTSAFSQPVQTAPTSVFGLPVQAAPTSVFGQPSQPTTTTPSVFGLPTQSQPASVFGQASFGQPAAQTSDPVIKPASGAFSAFSGTGPSAFAAAASTPPNTTNTTSGGGGGAFSAFAGTQPSVFGLPTTNTTSNNVFGQPSFGQPVPSANANQGSAFGAQTQSVFGQQQTQQPTSVFAANPAPTSAFGNPTTTAPTSVFGQSAFGGTPVANSVFGGSTPNVFGDGASPHQAQEVNLTDNPLLNPTPSIAMSSSSSSAAPAPASASKAKAPLDLSGLNAKFPYRPGSTPYDGMLPPNYMELIPVSVKEGFMAEKFKFGSVPEWFPPLELR